MPSAPAMHNTSWQARLMASTRGRASRGDPAQRGDAVGMEAEPLRLVVGVGGGGGGGMGEGTKAQPMVPS